MKSDPTSAVLSTLNPTGSQTPYSVTTHSSMVVKRITSILAQLTHLTEGQTKFREAKEPFQEVPGAGVWIPTPLPPGPLLLTTVLIHGGGFNEMSVDRNHPVQSPVNASSPPPHPKFIQERGCSSPKSGGMVSAPPSPPPAPGCSKALVPPERTGAWQDVVDWRSTSHALTLVVIDENPPA